MPSSVYRILKILIFMTETISRAGEGQPRPKYIFNKRFDPSPSPNFRLILFQCFYLWRLENAKSIKHYVYEIGHKRGKYFLLFIIQEQVWEKGGIMLDSDPEVDNRFLGLVSAWPWKKTYIKRL